jgi:hypothetical protein
MQVELSCPYCGEPLTFVVDETGGKTQVYIEDCAVCCEPIEVRVQVDVEEFDVQVKRLDE